jgi:GNAT superfamily N-acetyltransferase
MSHRGVCISVVPGTLVDYAHLACWHYVGKSPRAPVLVLTARAQGLATPAGVLVVTRPTLNGAWRASAWPGWLTGLGKRDSAQRINAELRCIARVVVDPRVRGLGVAGALIRHYLAAPLTAKTEAVARMGVVVPMFVSSGMRRVDGLHSSPQLSRLRSDLAAAGVRTWELADARVRRRVERDAGLMRRWRVWAQSAPGARGAIATAGLVEGTWPAVACDASAFVHENNQPGGKDAEGVG